MVTLNSSCVICGRPATDGHHIRVPGDAKGKKPPDTRCIPACHECHIGSIHTEGKISLIEQGIYKIISLPPKERQRYVTWLSSFLTRGDMVGLIKEAWGE